MSHTHTHTHPQRSAQGASDAALEREKIQLKMEKIAKKYGDLQHNEDNYNVGGGLSQKKFESKRHEDAKNDSGKETLGKAKQIFKTASGLELNEVAEIINYAVPYPEWHHAGKLPKKFGGGMKKTYFLKAEEIAEIAANWDKYSEKIMIRKQEKKEKQERKEKAEKYMKKMATKIERVSAKPKFFVETIKEMSGKFGWFPSDSKYNLPEYFSGWQFKSKKSLLKYYQILEDEFEVKRIHQNY